MHVAWTCQCLERHGRRFCNSWSTYDALKSILNIGPGSEPRASSRAMGKGGPHRRKVPETDLVHLQDVLSAIKLEGGSNFHEYMNMNK